MENKKTGPKPKKLTEGTIMGIKVGRGENQNVVPPEGVQELASIGCTDREIAHFYNIKEDTLRYNFTEYLEKGREYQKTRLRKNMFRAADNLNPAILIFLAKNVLGMSDQAQNTESNKPLPWIEENLDESDQSETEQSNSHNKPE